MSTLTMQALDCVNNERPMDLSLLDNPEVRDNLLVLAAKDIVNEDMPFTTKLSESLSTAVREYVGGKSDNAEELSALIRERIKSADEIDLLRLGAATDMSFALYFMTFDLKGLLATWGFISAYGLPLSSAGRMVLSCIEVGMPVDKFAEFLREQECYSEVEDSVDWSAVNWGQQTP